MYCSAEYGCSRDYAKAGSSHASRRPVGLIRGSSHHVSELWSRKMAQASLRSSTRTSHSMLMQVVQEHQ